MIQKIISRGSNGAEIAALAMAKVFRVQTGGYAVRKRRYGARPDRRCMTYALSTGISDPHEALRENIRTSDGTLWIGPDNPYLTIACRIEQRPFKFISTDPSDEESSPSKLATWVYDNSIRTLHVVADWELYTKMRISELLFECFKSMGYTFIEPPNKIPNEPWAVGFVWGSLFMASPWPTLKGYRWSEIRAKWVKYPIWRDIPHLLVAPPPEEVDRNAAFRKAIPVDMLKLAVEFPDDQPVVLQTICKLGTPALDLARTGAKTLLYLIACPWMVAQKMPSWRERKKLIRCKQREIAARLGFLNSESIAKILRKINPRDVPMPIPPLESLTAILAQPDIRTLLAHLPRINAWAMQIITEPALRKLVTLDFLRRVALAPAADDLTAWVEKHPAFWDFRYMATDVEICRILEMTPIRTIRHLERQVAQWRTNQVFPKPLFQGIPGLIEPLMTPAAMAAEGREMGHCVGQFTATATQSYFRILPNPVAEGLPTPSRATLEVVYSSRDSDWVIAPLKGVRNTAVSEFTQRLADVWLSIAMTIPDPGERQVFRNRIHIEYGTPEELRETCAERLTLAANHGRK